MGFRLMPETPKRSFRFDWLIITVTVAAMAFAVGWRRGVHSASNVALPPLDVSLVDYDAQRDALIARTPEVPDGELSLVSIYALQTNNREAFLEAADVVRAGWRTGYMPMLIETARFSRGPRRGWTSALIDELSGQTFAGDIDAAWRWVWNQEIEPHPQYGLFKAELYQLIDPRFAAYFDDHTQNATIRLDEVRWGGVKRDGIPPLKNPKMIKANSRQADYLDDDNVVFGIELNGDARAYPKRILAWHEMFKDTFGPADNQVSVAGVYCTLCGSMIVYDTVVDGTHHELGTSGFLYRSNKVMYDHATESMWSTITGEPTIGPLVGQGIKLKPLHVVTTTWGEWKSKHPETTVLSLDTGHQRDYGEGVAYRSYFGTDELMFTIPQKDGRLKNKAEVLALRFGGDAALPTVIEAAFLAETPVFHGTLGDTDYVVLTDRSGANRVYDASGVTFETYAGDDDAVSADGRRWQVSEDGLVAADGQTLGRLPAHRVFWFGWSSAHPDTVLIN